MRQRHPFFRDSEYPVALSPTSVLNGIGSWESTPAGARKDRRPAFKLRLETRTPPVGRPLDLGLS